jgi:hypothetical protein
VTKSADENQKTAHKAAPKIKSVRQSPRKEPSASAFSYRDADSGLKEDFFIFNDTIHTRDPGHLRLSQG